MSACRTQAEAAADVEGLLPPYDFDAEASVLSAVALDVSAMPKIEDFMRHEMFYPEPHRRIFEACVDLRRTKTPIDVTQIHGWLKARGRLEQVGGTGYLTEVIAASPVVANVRAHAVLVHDAWRRRQIIKACQDIVAKGYAGAGEVQPWCEAATRTLGAIGMQNPVRPIESNDQTLSRILADACEMPGPDAGPSTPMTGFPTRIFGLDRILGGLRKGGKTTIAASTGVGKTSMAIQVAVELAKQGVGVLFFSTEMKREEILRRALAAEAQISAVRIRDRKLSPAEKLTLAAAKERLGKLPLRIDETARITIEEVAAASKSMAEEMPYFHGVRLGALFLDYAQRVEPSRHMATREKHDQIGHSTRSYKILAQELDVVAVELAQAKEPDPRAKVQKPRAQNCVADSSQIAKESDDVIVLVAEDDPQDDPRQSVRAYVVKQRAGAKGEVALMFRRDQYRFVDPNVPNAMACPSRQYVDPRPDPEPPQGRFDDDNHIS